MREEPTIEYLQKQHLGGKGWIKTSDSRIGTYRVNSGSDDEFVVTTYEIGSVATRTTTYTRLGWMLTSIGFLVSFYFAGFLILLISRSSMEVCPIVLGIMFLGGTLYGTWWVCSLTYRPPREFERER